MAMMLPDGAGDDELMVELNTTPLIDVLLVLLVMLILSIPPQWHAVNMGLPVSAKPPDIKPQVIVLEVLPGDGLRWNGQILPDRQALQTHMQEASRLAPMMAFMEDGQRISICERMRLPSRCRLAWTRKCGLRRAVGSRQHCTL